MQDIHSERTIPNSYTNDSNNSSDPMKPKGLIVAYIGKAAYNAGGTTIHSAFFMPFN